MNAILFVLASVCLAQVVVGQMDMYDAVPDKGRNYLYYKFIETDSMHAACYYTLCYCGNKKYAGHLTTIHEDSCDTHRTGMAEKKVIKCLQSPTCKTSAKTIFGGLFFDLYSAIRGHRLEGKACKFNLANCYGMLLKDAVMLYDDSTSLSYFLQRDRANK